jgi:amino acid transporter
VLAKVHPRFQTPYISTLAVALISLLVGLLFSDRVDDLTRIVNFGALTAFLLLHLAVINYYLIRRRSGDWMRHLVFPLLGFLVIAYVLYEMDSSAKIMGACWIAIGIVYYLVLTFIVRRPAALEL